MEKNVQSYYSPHNQQIEKVQDIESRIQLNGPYKFNHPTNKIGNNIVTFGTNGPSAISFNKDGTRVVVGYSDATFESKVKHGIAVVYEWDGQQWSQLGVQLQTLHGHLHGVSCGRFGCDVSMDDDGTIVAVGQPTNINDGTPENSSHREISGRVFVYKYEYDDESAEWTWKKMSGKLRLNPYIF
jgi:hypothetical protein